jgi:hypothetical protein
MVATLIDVLREKKIHAREETRVLLEHGGDRSVEGYL